MIMFIISESANFYITNSSGLIVYIASSENSEKWPNILWDQQPKTPFSLQTHKEQQILIIVQQLITWDVIFKMLGDSFMDNLLIDYSIN